MFVDFGPRGFERVVLMEAGLLRVNMVLAHKAYLRGTMFRIKNIVSAAIAVAASLSLGAASAADLGAAPYAPEYIVPAYDWSGGYIGTNLGYGWGRPTDKSSLGTAAPTPLFVDTIKAPMNGVVGGAQIGYNWQTQNLLFGMEADFQGTGQSSTHSSTCPAGVCTSTLLGGFVPIAGPALPVTFRQQLDFFGTLRGRVGVVVIPAVLLYATAGFAYGQVDSNSTLMGSTRAQNFTPGWTVGAGIEGAIGGGWSARLEYLYLDLGSVSNTFASNVLAAGGLTTLIGASNSHVTDNIVRVGLNYKFSGPSVSKY
jgi:outer membrane immunogenic protein